MARGDQLGRQWKIIQKLLSSGSGKTAAELADSLNLHPRTVYRDLEALQSAGFPLYTEQRGRNSFWALLASARRPIPLPLDVTELMALYFSRDRVKMLKNTIYFDALETLFQKIKAMLPPEYLSFLERIEKNLEVGTGPYKPYGRFREIIDRVNEAMVQKRHIRIDYYSMSRKERTKRMVAPYTIWFFDNSFYMIGYCRLREEVRIFAVDRIRNLETTEEPFEVPDAFDAERFMRSSFGVFHGRPVQVKIRFSPKVSEYVSEKIWHDSQRIEPLADGSILFTAEVAGTDEIKFWILNWGAEAEVLAPEGLRTEIRAEAEAVLHRYGMEGLKE